MPGESEVSDTESEYEGCETVCSVLPDREQFDECGNCCYGCFCPCCDEDQCCLCGCCGKQIDCIGCGKRCHSCCTLIADFFVKAWSAIWFIVSFERHRKWLYGADVDPKQDGRNCFLSTRVSPIAEHRIVILCSITLSALDTATDVYLIYKWMTARDPLYWQAGSLCFVMFTSWTLSACLRSWWYPVQTDVPLHWKSCREFWCSSLPFHFLGLGVVTEGLKSLRDHDLENNYRNFNPYKWIEILFESGPSAMITLYVLSMGSISEIPTLVPTSSPTIVPSPFIDVKPDPDGDLWDEIRDQIPRLVAEIISVSISLISIAFGMAIVVTQEIPRGRHTSHIGEKSLQRVVMAVFLILSDLIFRLFVLIMWVNYGNLYGISNTFAKFGIGLGGMWVFEMILAGIGGMPVKYGAWWHLPLQAYTSIFQAGVPFFSRSWPTEDKANKGHTRNVVAFFIRYAINWAAFLWIYFELAQETNRYISQNWTTPLLVAGFIQPFLFMLKPPSLPLRDAYPVIRFVMENGLRRGTTLFHQKRTTEIATQRVSWSQQSSQRSSVAGSISIEL